MQGHIEIESTYKPPPLPKGEGWGRARRRLSAIFCPFTLCLLILSIPFAVQAEEAEPQNPATPSDPLQSQQVSLPDGPGSIGGLGSDFQPNPADGLVGYSLPLEFPPVRGGQLMLDLTLQYHSAATNGAVGIGWSLSIPAIERQTHDGIPTYTNQDIFLYQGEPLIELTDGSYAPRVLGEGNHLYRFYRLNQGWLGVDTKGLRYYFGRYADTNQTPNARISRQTDPAKAPNTDFSSTFKWHLDGVYDGFNNHIDYFYRYHRTPIGNPSYEKLMLSHIDYNQTITNQADGFQSQQKNQHYRILFHYENRQDVVEDYRAGFKQQMHYRLNRIEALFENKRLYSYQLNYHPEGLSRLSQLTRLAPEHSPAEAHKDSKSDTIDRLAPSYFSYTPALSTDTTLSPKSWNFPLSLILNRPTVRLIDLDGDARADILDTHQGKWQMARNLGKGSDGQYRFAAFQLLFLAPALDNPNISLFDANGDGFIDLIQKQGDALSVRLNAHTARRQGTNILFAPAQPFSHGLPFPLNDSNTRPMDINHDRRIDLVRTNPNGLWQYCLMSHYLDEDRYPYNNFPSIEDIDHNANNTLDATQFHCSGSVSLSIQPYTYLGNPQNHTGQLNSDKLLDWLYLFDTGNDYWSLNYWNHHQLLKFGSQRSYNTKIPKQDLINPTDLHLQDMDGDGLNDLLIVRPNKAIFYRHQGNEFAPPITLTIPNYDPSLDKIHFASLTANGCTDLIISGIKRLDSINFCHPIKPNLLSEIDNGQGRLITFDYHNAQPPIDTNTTLNLNWLIPHPLIILSTLTDTIQDYTTNQPKSEHQKFHYQQPYYDAVQNKFNAFARVEHHSQATIARPTLIQRYQFHTGAPDNQDNDGNNQIDEINHISHNKRIRNRIPEAYALIGKLKSQQHRNHTQALQQQQSRYRIRLIHPPPPQQGNNNIPASKGSPVWRSEHTQLTQTEFDSSNPNQSASKQIDYQFDLFGNIIEEHHLGRTDQPNDERLIRHQYAQPQSNHYARNRPILSITDDDNTFNNIPANDNDPTPPTYQRHYYDGLPSGEVSIGALTKSQQWSSQDNKWLDQTQTQYDAYGNPTNIQQGTLNPITLRYDDQYALFLKQQTQNLPNTANNQPQSLIQTFTFDPRFIKPTQAINPNGTIIDIEYDAFGRPIQGSQSNPNDPNWQTKRTLARYAYIQINPWRNKYYSSGESTLINHLKTQIDLNQGPSLIGQATHYDTHRIAYQHQYQNGKAHLLATLNQRNTNNYIAQYQHIDLSGLTYRQYRPFTAPTPRYAFPNASNGQTNTPYTQTQYDAISRPINQTLPPDINNQHSHITIQYVPFTILITDPNGQQRRQQQDGLGRNIEQARLDSTTWLSHTFTYNHLNQPTQATDPEGNTRTVSYDSIGRKISQHHPSQGTYTYQYNPNNQLTYQHHQDGFPISYQYDAIGRPTQQQWHHNSQSSHTLSYYYDQGNTATNSKLNLGRLTRIQGNHFQKTYHYDGSGQIHQQQTQLLNFATQTLNIRYNHAKQPLQIQTQINHQQFTQYQQFNLSGQRTRISGIADFEYQPDGTLKTLTHRNGVITTIQQDPRGRLTTLNHQLYHQGKTHPLNQTHQHDAIGNIIQIQYTSHSETFQYDGLHRLTQATGPYQKINYTYDSIDNLTKKTSLNPKHHQGTYQYTPSKPTQLQGTDRYAFQYDTRGNLIDDGTYTHQYNAHNHRIQSTRKQNNQTLRYIYDEQGTRIAKLTPQNTTPTAFTLYYPNNLIVKKTTLRTQILLDIQNQHIRLARIHLNPANTHNTQQSLNLTPGWNLHQINGQISNPNTYQKTLQTAGVRDGYMLVPTTQRWKKLSHNRNDFEGKTLPSNPWVWLRATTQTTLILHTQPANPNDTLNAGWHLYQLKKDQSLAQLQSQFNQHITKAYNAQNTQQHWFAEPYQPLATLSSTQTLTAGTTLWIELDANTLNPQLKGLNLATQHYHSNHLGSIQAISDNKGNIIKQITYTPYGSVHQDTSYQSQSLSQPPQFDFISKEQDQTDHHYFEARYYFADVGRFLSVDPLIGSDANLCIQDISQCNLYAYSRNNPILYQDESGELTFIGGQQGTAGGVSLSSAAGLWGNFTNNQDGSFTVEWGIYGSGDVGKHVGMPSVTGGVEFGYLNTDDSSALNGDYKTIGGSISMGNYSVGAEAIKTSNDVTGSILNISPFSLGVVGPTAHLRFGSGWSITISKKTFKLPKIIKDFISWWNNTVTPNNVKQNNNGNQNNNGSQNNKPGTSSRPDHLTSQMGHD